MAETSATTQGKAARKKAESLQKPNPEANDDMPKADGNNNGGGVNGQQPPNAHQPPEAEKPKESFIYIGPTLPGSALTANKVFQGSREEIETLLADILEKYPKLAHLLVPTRDLAVSKAKIRAANSYLGKCYTELKADFAKGVVNNGV